LLLEAGEDPSRYNPIGAHSHSTPLHQAALAGHREAVKLLVEHGAKLDMRDTIWNATPAEWARHEKRSEIEAYLREQERAAKAETRSPRT
jgi:ankyrin repeat protein